MTVRRICKAVMRCIFRIWEGLGLVAQWLARYMSPQCLWLKIAKYCCLSRGSYRVGRWMRPGAPAAHFKARDSSSRRTHRSGLKSRGARSFRCQPQRRKSMVGRGENTAGFVSWTVSVVKSELGSKRQGTNIYSGSLKQFIYIADRKAWINHRLAQCREFHFVRSLSWITPPTEAAGFRQCFLVCTYLKGNWNGRAQNARDRLNPQVLIWYPASGCSKPNNWLLQKEKLLFLTHYLPSLTNTESAKRDVNTSSYGITQENRCHLLVTFFFNLSLRYGNVIYLPVDTYSWATKALYELLLCSSSNLVIGFAGSKTWIVAVAN